MEVREFRGDDLFTLVAIIDKLGLAEQGAAVLSGGRPGEDARSVGLRAVTAIASTVMHRLGDVHDDLHRLLGDLTGTDPEAIGALSAVDYIDLVKRVMTSPGLVEVFTQLGSLVGLAPSDSGTSGTAATVPQTVS